MAAPRQEAAEVPPPGPRRYRTRRGIAALLVERFRSPVTTLAGIDHSFSLPLRYFEAYRLSLDWLAFLDDFQRPRPTDEDNRYVDFVRNGVKSGSR